MVRLVSKPQRDEKGVWTMAQGAQGLTTALGIIREAMRLEQEGHDFYVKAAGVSMDRKAKDIFCQLASDEENHLKLLKREYSALNEHGRWEAAAKAAVPPALHEPLFPKGKGELPEKTAAGSAEKEALVFGLNIESKSFDLYRKAALETTEPAGRAVFELLVSEERNHFNILMMRYEQMSGPVGWQS